MRSPAFPVILLACLSLSGCSTGSDIDALQVPGPSQEVTSSIVKPGGPVPAAEVGMEGSAPLSEAAVTALAEPDGLDTPAAKQVALVAPPKPSLRPQALAGGAVVQQRFRDAKPVSFGKAKPQHHAVHGVDVSRWQGEIDWPKLRQQGANFAWIKATDGGDHLDPMFRTNWKRAAAAGIPRGAYHFFYWCRTASSQADWFIRNVPKQEGALPPVLDVEFNHQSDCKRRWSREDVIEKMQVFMDRLEKHYGQRPIIYTAPDFYAAYLKGAFPNHPFWLRSVAAHPSKVYPGRDWLFWQYSGSGLSHGVDGRIDLNVFSGSESDWHRWVAKVAG